MTSPHEVLDAESETLLARALTGDAAAVVDLYDAYGAIVFSLSAHLLGDSEEAAVITHRVFVELGDDQAEVIHLADSVGTLIVLRAHYLALKRAREIGTDRAFEQRSHLNRGFPIGVNDNANATPWTMTLAERVRVAIGSLPERRRHVLELAYCCGCSVTRISELLTLSPDLVTRELRVGMTTLRHILNAPLHRSGAVIGPRDARRSATTSSRHHADDSTAAPNGSAAGQRSA